MRFSDGTVMRLYRQTVEDFGLYPEMELSDAEFQHLQTEAGQMSAKMRAVRIVSASNVSKQDLERRLVQKGENPEQAKRAVQWMSDLALVDDRRTARQIVESCIRKGYGLARAKQALFEKRIPKEFWEDALADYPEQLDKIVAYLRKCVTADADEKTLRKAIDSLMRKGHRYAAIKKALSMLSVDTDEFPED